MKKLLVLIITLPLSIGVYAQIEKPIKWAYAAKHTGTNEAVVFLKANIQPGWHIYSLNVKKGGPTKTSFNFAPAKNYTLVGKTVEPSPKIKFEKSFKMNVGYFENEVVFQQKIKLKSTAPADIKGSLEYAVCNNMKCLPPEELNFTVALNK